MLAANALASIRLNLNRHLGERVVLRTNRGRKRVVEREGILEQTYPNLFIIKLDAVRDNVAHVSYSYADLVSRTVELSVKRQGRDRAIGLELPDQA